MSVVPNRGTRGRRTLSGLRTRRPARGFGQKKDFSINKKETAQYIRRF